MFWPVYFTALQKHLNILCIQWLLIIKQLFSILIYLALQHIQVTFD